MDNDQSKLYEAIRPIQKSTHGCNCNICRIRNEQEKKKSIDQKQLIRKSSHGCTNPACLEAEDLKEEGQDIANPNPARKLLPTYKINELVMDKCDQIKEMLCSKNISYDSALYRPINILSPLSAKEACWVRIDDKLSRLKSGTHFKGDNDLMDLAGYIIGLIVIMEMDELVKPND